MELKNRIVSTFTSLSDREKKILVIFSFVVYFFITAVTYFMLSGSIADERDAIAEKKKIMIEMSGMKNIYRRVQRKKDRMLDRIRGNKTNLSSYISGVKEAVGVDLNTIKDLKPKQVGEFRIEQVQLGMRKIALPSLMAFLYNLEDGTRYIFIRSAKIDSRYDKQNYNASIVVATLKESEEE